MILLILRAGFLLLVLAITALHLDPLAAVVGEQFQGWQTTGVITAALLLALAVIAADMLARERRLGEAAGAFFGLIAGLVVAYALSFVVDLGAEFAQPRLGDVEAFARVLQGLKVLIGLVTCYLAISIVLQTRDDFRFVIPYVEFAKDVRGTRQSVLDTSVIIDGRIVDIVPTGIIQETLIVPRLVLEELQAIADSPDRLKRARGRRGLDNLRKLQELPDGPRIKIIDARPDATSTDQKLVSLAEQMQARLMTNDMGLNKIARLRGVEVVNLNDVALALRPVVLPGEPLTVQVIKPGESPPQGVGYLDDGTMVVVENGRELIGHEVQINVTKMLPTTSGRMIFGRFEGKPPAPDDGHDRDPRRGGQ